MSSYSRQQLESWLKTITVPSNSNCLDIGGSQNPIQPRLGSIGENCQFKILDLEHPHEVKQKPDIVCDLNQIFDFNYNEKYCEVFDIAFCLEVSEYWFNPIQALQNINVFLKKDGILYISFHQQYPVHNPIDQDYIRYTPQGAEKLLQETGFEIQEMKSRKMNDFNSYWNWAVLGEGMKPSKNYDCHDWSGCLVKAKKVN